MSRQIHGYDMEEIIRSLKSLKTQNQVCVCSCHQTSAYDQMEEHETGLSSILNEGLTDDIRLSSGKLRQVKSASSSSDRMLHQRRRRMRPLGLVVLDSRLETQVEKALFQTNIRLLSQLIGSQGNPLHARPNTPTNGEVNQSALSTQTKEYMRINNASTARYHSKILDRVVSAGGERRIGSGCNRYQRPLCCRQNDKGSNSVKCQQSSHCEVLGPYYCTDCIQIRKRSKSALQQTRNFPDIEVHPRSLIAPEKLEKLLIHIPQASTVQFSDRKPRSRSASRTVYTGNDIYSRLRETHKQQGNRVFGKSVKSVPNTAGLLPPNLFENERRKRQMAQKTQKSVLAVPKANTHIIRFDIPSSR